MAAITFEDCVAEFSLSSELLGTKCSDKHIRGVSRFLDWRGVAPYLGLTESEVDGVDSDGRDEQDKRLKTLQKWKRRFCFRATHKSLIQALLDSGRADHAEEVCRLLQKDVLVPLRVKEEDLQGRELQRREQKLKERELELQEKEKDLKGWEEEQRGKAEVNILDPDSAFETSQCSALPLAMCGVQAVVHNGTIYVARGWSSVEGREPVTLCAYNVAKDSWSVLSIQHGSHPTVYFTVVLYDNKLVVVGGLNCSTSEPTNEVTICKDDTLRPIRPPRRCFTRRFSTSAIVIGTLPPMPTPRFSTSAIGRGEYLIVAGGKVNLEDDTNVVEVYNANDQTWFQAVPLPVSSSFMKAVCISGRYYLSGGNGQGRSVFCADINSLIAQNAVWKSLPELPYGCSSVATLGGCLLAAGGMTSDNTHSRALLVFSPHIQSWVTVGELPEPVSMTCIITLASRELLVIGGSTESGLSSSVYKFHSVKNAQHTR